MKANSRVTQRHVGLGWDTQMMRILLFVVSAVVSIGLWACESAEPTPIEPTRSTSPTVAPVLRVEPTSLSTPTVLPTEIASPSVTPTQTSSPSPTATVMVASPTATRVQEAIGRTVSNAANTVAGSYRNGNRDCDSAGYGHADFSGDTHTDCAGNCGGREGC